MSGRYGPGRLVADVIEAASAQGLCAVFAGEDVDRALAGARQVLDALHLPADELPRVMVEDEAAAFCRATRSPVPPL